MAFGIIIYKSFNQYIDFVMADETLYDMMKESLSTERDKMMYGMEYINGRKGISDERIDEASNHFHSLVERLNAGEKLDLDSELEDM